MDTLTTPARAADRGKLSGRLWVLGAALLWSTSGLFARADLFADWQGIQGPLFAFWRAGFAAVVLMPTIRRPRWSGLLVPLAISFAAMNVTYLTALTQTTAANAIWLQSTAPWWVFLISAGVIGEPVVRRDLIPLAFGLVGVGAILWFEVQGQDRLGVICGLASGVTYALVVLFMRTLRHEDPSWLVALNHAVAALVMLPWMLYLGVWPTLAQLIVLAGFGVLQMGIPYTFLIRGLRSISSQEAVAIGLLEPILMPTWVWLVYGERPAWWTLLGAALIFSGLVLRYVIWNRIAGVRAAG